MSFFEDEAFISVMRVKAFLLNCLFFVNRLVNLGLDL